MTQKFFTDTIESKFIKYVLKNSPLPVYPSVEDGGYVISGCTYTSKYGIIRCTKTGKLETNFTRLYPYTFGLYYPAFTEKYLSKYNYYDTDTHEYLGKYLRLYRDFFDVDLMPFYNCFSYRFFEDIYLTTENQSGYSIGNNSNYKIVAIPITFDKKYTIAIDSKSPVLMKAIFHDKISRLTEGISKYRAETTEFLKNCSVNIDFNNEVHRTTNDYVVNVPFMSFNNTVKFEIKLDTPSLTDAYKRKLKNMEKYLYLAIQLPAENSSSIVVLEGDYTNNDINTNYYNIENVKDAIPDILLNGSNFIKSNIAKSDQNVSSNTVISLMNRSNKNKVNKFMITDLSLLEMGTANAYAFSNRLIEYLLLNVVDSQDTIDENTIKAQNIFKLFNLNETMPGVWDNRLRFDLYKQFVYKDKNNSYDINGFIDKDIEKMLISMDGDY